MSSPTLQPLTGKLPLPSHHFSDTFPVRLSQCLRFPFPSPPLSCIPLEERKFPAMFFSVSFPSPPLFQPPWQPFPLFWAARPLSGLPFSASSQHPYVLTVACIIFISGLLSFFLLSENTENNSCPFPRSAPLSVLTSAPLASRRQRGRTGLLPSSAPAALPSPLKRLQPALLHVSFGESPQSPLPLRQTCFFSFLLSQTLPLLHNNTVFSILVDVAPGSSPSLQLLIASGLVLIRSFFHTPLPLYYY